MKLKGHPQPPRAGLSTNEERKSSQSGANAIVMTWNLCRGGERAPIPKQMAS